MQYDMGQQYLGLDIVFPWQFIFCTIRTETSNETLLHKQFCRENGFISDFPTLLESPLPGNDLPPLHQERIRWSGGGGAAS